MTGLLDALRAAGVEIGPGLGDQERASLEKHFGFSFPPDLAELLAGGVPVGDRFPDWHGGPEAVAERMDAPADGLLFDVRQNGLWLPEWDRRPSSDDQAEQVARQALDRVPRLVPVWAHRYIPSRPARRGNPVLSVMQADIIVYGADLADYFVREFKIVRPAGDTDSTNPRDVPFWSQFLD